MGDGMSITAQRPAHADSTQGKPVTPSLARGVYTVGLTLSLHLPLSVSLLYLSPFDPAPGPPGSATCQSVLDVAMYRAMRTEALMAFPAYATRCSACSAVAPGPTMPMPTGLVYSSSSCLKTSEQVAPISCPCSVDPFSMYPSTTTASTAPPASMRSTTRGASYVPGTHTTWSTVAPMLTAATRASSNMRSMSVLWNSPMTTPTRTGASEPSPTWNTEAFSHLDASSGV
mmetsp:Transcript_18522/g.46085  ORF Transcript_18522/g.46085 Transcript_18522/m.46085 type:complete len:229 (+) Transcript_18522:503-1189(+)